MLALVVLLVGGWAAASAPLAWGQQEQLQRKVKTRVEPAYPALARRMHIEGVVKVEVTVSPNGSVKEAKAVGGHPLFVAAALDAVKKWRFETSPGESSGIVEFRFDPGH
jgi:TonB family protein